MPRLAPACCALLLFWSLGAERAGVRAGLPESSDRVVSYTIQARLDPSAKEVAAEMDLVWRNTSGQPVDQLYFHLYLNAFQDENSTYIREGNGNGKAGEKFDTEYPGSIRIDRMRTADGTDLWQAPALAFVAPDDGNEKDRTLARVQLPAPVPPGETLSLNVAFRSRLPRVLHRTGWSGDPADPESLFFMVAQWFPKVAVLRTDAEGQPHWNAHQFHRNTEFFSDYGEYRVSLTVPDSYEVGATGVPSPPVRTEEGWKTITFEQADVHDFAWTASPRFAVKEYAWSFDSFCDAAPGEMGHKLRDLLARTARHREVDVDALKPQQPVSVRILHQRDHTGVVDRLWHAAGAALACYGIWFGQYPYPVLTIVDVPAGGGAAGGMEYPTLITVWADRHAPPYATGMEGVTIHEFGHQFFYGLLGSNEFEEAWLDEGFTSYTDARTFETAYGPWIETTRYGPLYTPYLRPFEAPRIWARVRDLTGLGRLADDLPRPWKKPASLLPVPEANAVWDYVRDLPRLHLDRDVAVPAPLWERKSWLASDTHDAMVMPGWEFASRGDYATNSYRKPTLFLYCLRGLMGEEAFDRALYAYAEKYRFRHPTTADFVAEVTPFVPEDTKPTVAGFMEEMIDSASSFDVALIDVSQREVAGEGGAARWEWTIRVQRRGTLVLPITVTATGKDGNAELLDTWRPRPGETTRTYRVRRDQELASVRLGPDWLRDLDGDLSNDAWALDADPLPARALAARWTFFAEEILRSYARADR